MGETEAILDSELSLYKESSFEESSRKVHHFAWGAAAAGLLPGPVFDFAGVFGVQMWLIKRLSTGYGVPFNANLATEFVGGLLGALIPTQLGHGFVGVAIRSVPVVGPFIGMTVAPGFNYAATLVVGRAFEKHFASGGTFLDFDLESIKGQVVNEYNELRVKLKGKKSKTSLILEQHASLTKEIASLRENLANYEQQVTALRAELKSQTPKTTAPPAPPSKN